MHNLDYTGPQGGLVAGAVIATAVAISMFWIGIGATLWRLFFEPRIKELKALREEDNKRCAQEMSAMAKRIAELETITILYGGIRLISETLPTREEGPSPRLKEGGYWQIGGPPGSPPRWVNPPQESES